MLRSEYKLFKLILIQAHQELDQASVTSYSIEKKNHQSQIYFYCFKNLVYITTCFGGTGHLRVIQNIYKIVARILKR